MPSVQEIIASISYLQVKIPEDLFRLKRDLEEVSIYENDPYVLGLLKKNERLRKKNRRLNKKIERMERLISMFVNLHNPAELSDEVDNNDVNIKYEVIEPEVEAAGSYEVEAAASEELENDFVATDAVEVEADDVEEEYVEVEEEDAADAVDVEVAADYVEEEEVATDAVEVEVEEEEVEVEEEEVDVEEEVEYEEVEEEEEAGVVQGAAAPVEAAPVEEEEEAVYEVTIKGKTYYVMNEVDSIIYDADENGDICIEAGIYKKGKPTFYK